MRYSVIADGVLAAYNASQALKEKYGLDLTAGENVAHS